MTISFILKGGPKPSDMCTIYLRYTNGDRFQSTKQDPRTRISTRTKVRRRDWNGERVITKGRKGDVLDTAKLKNKALDTFYNRAELVAETWRDSHGRYPLPRDFKKWFLHGEVVQLGFWDAWEKYLEAQRVAVSKGTIRNLETLAKTLNKFEGAVREIRNHEIGKPLIRELMAFMQGEGLRNSTINTRLVNLKNFLKYANSLEGWETIPPERLDWKRLKQDPPFKLFLTDQELETFRDHIFLSAYQRKVQSIFLFHCEVGCRYGELKSLKRYGDTIKLYRPKRNDDITAILTERAKYLLEEFGGVVPVVHENTYNRELKKLFRLAGIDEPRYHLGQEYKVCDKISSHASRRYFGNRAYRVWGWEIATISLWFGHISKGQPNIKQTMEYLDITSHAQDQLITQRFQE